MRTPTWIRDSGNYAHPETKGGREAVFLKQALLIALHVLHNMKKDHTMDPDRDCLGCDFGPCNSTKHHPGCVYLCAVQALNKIRKIGKSL